MYKVLYRGKAHKAFRKSKFTSYDAARNAARKYIRSQWPISAASYTNSNPAISDFGFSVKAV